ncbi:MAG: DUF721 domain-containing protein [Planctomycetaceae bacterium]|nr:DUF721 domain-containing protein [Planctomycetaceae bacterium]
MEPRSSRQSDQPQHVGDVLSQLFALRGFGRAQAGRQMQDVWREVAGDFIAGQTRVQRITNGSLHIAVSSSALLQELESFHKWSLLERLKNEHADLRIRDLKFSLRSARTS